MAGVNKKVSAASARAHTRRSNENSSLKLPSGIFLKILLVLFVGILAWAYQVIKPPPPKLGGSPGGPPITAPRIKLRDGRHLAYKEYGVSKDVAKYKIVFLHGLNGNKDHNIATVLSPEIFEELGMYFVSIDRPGYGESDPHPERTLKSLALDIEELADQLGLGSKFYMIGLSMGGALTWSCIKYIPNRLAGVTLLTPAINYWWPGLPANLSTEAFSKLFPSDQWALRVAHYVPWLTYWWNTQKWFPGCNYIANVSRVLSQPDKDMEKTINKIFMVSVAQTRQQGEYESIHRDLMIALGTWEFDPLDLENPFPNGEGSVHLWQGDEDNLVPVTLQRYIGQQLSWIHYHELSGYGHSFAWTEGMADKIIKTMLRNSQQ